jgi:hypothetical protein
VHGSFSFLNSSKNAIETSRLIEAIFLRGEPFAPSAAQSLAEAVDNLAAG